MFPSKQGTPGAGQTARVAAEKDWASMLVNFLHWVALAFILALSLIICIFVASSDEAHVAFHIKNTILQQYDSDSLVNTYIPVSKPISEDNVMQNFYGCLMLAEVGVDNVYNCPVTDINSYKSCIDGFANSTSKVRRMVTLISTLLSDLKISDATAAEMQNLPNYLISTSKDVLTAQLTAYNSRLALKQQLTAQSTSLSVQILDIIDKTEKMSGLSVCTSSVTATQLTEYSANYDIHTAFDRLWKCASDIVITNSIQKRAYDRCIPLSAWPAKDVVQTPYSDTLMGSYNKYFTAWMGAWLLASFAVYTMPFMPSVATSNGKPANFFARAGKFLVGLGFIWNALGGIIPVLVYGLSPSSNLKYAPMSIQTFFLTLLFTVAASIYFGRELYELFFLSEGVTPGMFPKWPTAQTGARVLNGQRFHSIQAFMTPPANAAQELPEEYYAPLVVPVWCDAFVFVDVLLFLSVIGTANDTVTVDLVVVAFSIIAAALSNSALVRLLQVGFVDVQKVVPDESQVPIFVLRVMSMIASLVGLIFSIVAIFLVGARFGNQTVTWYVALTTLIPQAMWFFYVVSLDMLQTISNQYFFRTISGCFSFALIIRAIFLTILLSGMDTEYKATVGDSDSVKSLLNLLNTESVLPVIPSFVTY